MTRKLGSLLGEDKGEEAYGYETICKDDLTNENYSFLVPTELENLNLLKYKRWL